MKKFKFFNRIYLLIYLLTVSYVCNAQVDKITPDPYFKTGKLHDAMLEKALKPTKHDDALVYRYSEDIVNGEKLQKHFTVKIDEPGDYFLAAFVNAVYDLSAVPVNVEKEKKYPLQKIAVFIDGSLFDYLDIKQSGWINVKPAKNKKITLSQGEHQFVFESQMPNTPDVSLMKLSKSNEKAVFENKEYEVYLDKLNANMLRNKDNRRKIEQSEIDAEVDKTRKLKSASNPNATWEVYPYVLDMKGGDYNNVMNVPVVYTYYKKVYFNSGTNVDFYTIPNPPNSYFSVDPIMYLFCESNTSYTWVNDDGYSGFQPRITVTIPVSGYYYLVLRAFSNSWASTYAGMQGIVDVYNNGALYQDDAPVSGYMTTGGTSGTGLFNYFTAYSTGIPKIWLSTTGGGGPLKFHGSTYWYVPPMDYLWSNDARFRISKGEGAMSTGTMVSSEGAWWVYWGNCDLYSNVRQGTTNEAGGSSIFPNLKDNDVMKSAPNVSTYNCGAWAGGITSDWVWYKGNGLWSWSSFDNYLANNPLRYTGAESYIPGGNSNDGIIALWTLGNDTTHLSVRKEGNQNPHGYDWESKCGQGYRIFHPRDALSGPLYGNIVKYYKKTEGLKSGELTSNYSSKLFSYEESIRQGLTVKQDIKLTEFESSQIDNLKKSILFKSSESFNLKRFEELYNSWFTICYSEKYTYISNPDVFFGLTEYKTLLNYCKNEDAIPIIMEKIFNKNDNLKQLLLSVFFVDLTSKTYGHLMNEVKEDWKKNNYTKEGSYVAPSDNANVKNYIKKIIANNIKNSSKIENLNDNTIMSDNHENFKIYPNPVKNFGTISFNLKSQSFLTLSIYNTDGERVMILIDNKNENIGKHTINFNAVELKKGIYFCKLTIENHSYIRKILIE